MKILDLCQAYADCILGGNDLSAYENSYPALFDHYFHYWAKRDAVAASLSREEALRRRDMVAAGLGRLEIRFAQAGFDLADLTVVLFVGRNTSNGHAFKDQNRFIVWLPVETYTTPLLVDVFVTHEIIHALHYAAEPRFYFENRKERHSVSRQLITEGVATWLTAAILEVDAATALWADHLDPMRRGDWMRQCQNRRAELARFVIDNYYSDDPGIELFVIADTDDIFRFRAGYFIGYEVIRAVANQLESTPHALLSQPRPEFEDAVLRTLHEMAAG